jgi:copper chaperone CopZ
MFRRNFIQRITLATAGVGLAAARTVQVAYRVKGFTCVTCAVGLDTMLRRQKGVVRSKSTYPDATTVIEFNPSLVTEESLKAFIAEMGFSVEKLHPAF